MLEKLFIYFKATRPKFLSITVLGVLIGLTLPSDQIAPEVQWFKLLGVMLLAVTAHSAANVINDYFDDLNGSDKINTSRISPFTGGSRFIQEKILSSTEIKQLASFLFLIVSIGGIALSLTTTITLIWVGLLGVTLGWFYSANPIKLMSRGIWGEIAIIICWALIIIGSNLIKNNQISQLSILEGLAYGFMICNILLINQIPDIEADKSAFKFTLAVQVGQQNVWKWFLLFLITSYGIVTAIYFFNIDRPIALIGLITLPLGLFITYRIKSKFKDRSTLTLAIKQTILLSHLFGFSLIAINLI